MIVIEDEAAEAAEKAAEAAEKAVDLTLFIVWNSRNPHGY